VPDEIPEYIYRIRYRRSCRMGGDHRGWIFLKGSTAGHPILHVFGGFLLGMLSMYFAMRLYRS